MIINDILNPVLSFLENHSLVELRETHGIRYNIKEHLVTLAYDQFEAKIDNEIANLCRGLVIAREDGNPVTDDSVAFGKATVLAFPFIRFFNFGQKNVSDAFKPVKVYEKHDGTCAIVYFDKFKSTWNVATRNVPDGSNFADGTMEKWTFKKLFEKAALDTVGPNFWYFLNPNYTYVFELMTPVNQVVVRHDSFKIVLIGIRDMNSGEELMVDGYSSVIPLATSYDDLLVKSFDDLVVLANERDPLAYEGFVVLGSNWERIKIKSSKYVSYNHVHDFTNYDILNYVLTGEIDDFIPLMANEYQKQLVVDISSKVAAYCKLVNHEFNELKKLNGSFATKKDFALHVQKNKLLCQHGRYVYRAYDENVMGVNLSVFVDIQDSIKKFYYDSNTKRYSDNLLRMMFNDWL